MIMRTFTIGLLAVVVCLIPRPTAAQNEELYDDAIDVSVVGVEVVVSDKNGQPITGLTRDDFELYEDGELMELSNFYASRGAGGTSAGGATTEPPKNRPLHLVIFIDQLNIGPRNRSLLFDRLRQDLRDKVSATDQIMVATLSSKLVIAQAFTADHDRIFAVLDDEENNTSFQALFAGEERLFRNRLASATLQEYTPQQSVILADPVTGATNLVETEGDPEFDNAVREAMDLAISARFLAERRTQRVQATLGALGGLCDTLGGLPGRKALLYLSDGLPVRPADPLLESWSAKFESWAIGNESDVRQRSRLPEAAAEFQRVITSLGSSQFDLHKDFNRLGEQASDDQVAFYPISNSRVGGSGTADIRGRGVYTGTGGSGRAGQVAENVTRNASLLQIAEDTGGSALVGTANLGDLMGRVRSDFESYYSLGYSPTHRDPDDAFHKIQIKVRREGAFARHVKGIRTKNWRQRLGEMTAAAALYEIESNPFGVRLTTGETRQEGKLFRVPVTVMIPFEQIRLVHQDNHFNAQLTVLIQVTDSEDGGLSETRRFDLPIKVPDDQVLEALTQVATYSLELEMKPGHKRVAIGVHDHLAHTEATTKYDLVRLVFFAASFAALSLSLCENFSIGKNPS